MSVEHNKSEMRKAEVSTLAAVEKATKEVYKRFKEEHKGNNTSLVAIAGTEQGQPILYKQNHVEHPSLRELRYSLMKEALLHKIPAENLGKSAISLGSNIYGYDLRAPSLHLIPFLSPIRDKMSRVQHAQPGDAAHWKTIRASTFNSGGFLADPWINEGARAPQISVSAANNTATYVTIGIDGADTFEAQNAGRGFEDPLSTAKFLALEALMVKEEDAILGGNNSLELGTANTPTLVAGSGGTISGTYYVACVALTYSGIRNQSVSAGIIQQMNITTPDGKTMQVNGGVGGKSAVSSSASPSTQKLTATVTPKAGELGYAWYLGTATNALYLQSITTVPTATFTSAPSTGTQLFSALASGDFSVNDGTTGDGSNQVTAFDGLLVQAISASQEATPNSYYRNLAGVGLTASGRGGVVEIDAALKYAWDNFRTTYSVIYVNSQELMNITTAALSNASAPLLRYDVSGDGEHYDLTASGTIGFYFNPFINGGSKIPIVVHPTIPAGTILLYGDRLPATYKKSNMTNVAEIICRQDYYSIDWPSTTREYQFGTYAEEVLAVYAPFCLGVITAIGATNS